MSKILKVGPGILLLFFVMGCQPAKRAEQLKQADKAEAIETKSDYSGAEQAAWKFIETELYPEGEWREFMAEDRRFSVAEYDLNGSGESEILLVLPTLYHCGSGGCRLWILDQKSRLLSTTSVIDFPIGISTNLTSGWHDLLTWSNNSQRILRYGENAYSANASTATTISEEKRNELTVTEVLSNPFKEFLQF